MQSNTSNYQENLQQNQKIQQLEYNILAYLDKTTSSTTRKNEISIWMQDAQSIAKLLENIIELQQKGYECKSFQIFKFCWDCSQSQNYKSFFRSALRHYQLQKVKNQNGFAKLSEKQQKIFYQHYYKYVKQRYLQILQFVKENQQKKVFPRFYKIENIQNTFKIYVQMQLGLIIPRVDIPNYQKDKEDIDVDVGYNYFFNFFSPETKIKFLKEITQCLKIMHQQKIEHNDVKIDNIIYSIIDKRFKLIDFDLSRIRKNQNKMDISFLQNINSQDKQLLHINDTTLTSFSFNKIFYRTSTQNGMKIFSKKQLIYMSKSPQCFYTVTAKNCGKIDSIMFAFLLIRLFYKLDFQKDDQIYCLAGYIRQILQQIYLYKKFKDLRIDVKSIKRKFHQQITGIIQKLMSILKENCTIRPSVSQLNQSLNQINQNLEQTDSLFQSYQQDQFQEQNQKNRQKEVQHFKQIQKSINNIEQIEIESGNRSVASDLGLPQRQQQQIQQFQRCSDITPNSQFSANQQELKKLNDKNRSIGLSILDKFYFQQKVTNKLIQSFESISDDNILNSIQNKYKQVLNILENQQNYKQLKKLFYYLHYEEKVIILLLNKAKQAQNQTILNFDVGHQLLEEDINDNNIIIKMSHYLRYFCFLGFFQGDICSSMINYFKITNVVNKVYSQSSLKIKNLFQGISFFYTQSIDNIFQMTDNLSRISKIYINILLDKNNKKRFQKYKQYFILGKNYYFDSLNKYQLNQIAEKFFIQVQKAIKIVFDEDHPLYKIYLQKRGKYYQMQKQNELALKYYNKHYKFIVKRINALKKQQKLSFENLTQLRQLQNQQLLKAQFNKAQIYDIIMQKQSRQKSYLKTKNLIYKRSNSHFQIKQKPNRKIKSKKSIQKQSTFDFLSLAIKELQEINHHIANVKLKEVKKKQIKQRLKKRKQEKQEKQKEQEKQKNQ